MSTSLIIFLVIMGIIEIWLIFELYLWLHQKELAFKEDEKFFILLRYLFERLTAATYASKLKALSKNMETLKICIGNALLPISLQAQQDIKEEEEL